MKTENLSTRNPHKLSTSYPHFSSHESLLFSTFPGNLLQLQINIYV